LGLTDGNLASALSRLSGEAAADSPTGAFQMMNQFLGLMLDPSVDGRGSASGPAMGFAPEQAGAPPPDVALAYAKALKTPTADQQRWTGWSAAYGGYNKTNGDPVVGSSNVTAGAGGFAAGMDYRLTPETVAGFALAGGGTNWDLAQRLGGGKSDALQVGLYGKTRSGPAYLAASLAFTNHWMSTDRFAFAGDHLTASFNAQSYGGRIEAGYHLAATAVLAAAPYAAIQAQSSHPRVPRDRSQRRRLRAFVQCAQLNRCPQRARRALQPSRCAAKRHGADAARRAA
jgi:uncharacterized protein with beta-barrel porin domain